MKKHVLFLLCLLLCLAACSGCKAAEDGQTLQNRLEQEMYELHKVSDEVAGDWGNVVFALRSLHYGSFSSSAAQELVALFDYSEPFGPSGNRALWLALYDAASMELLAETQYGVYGISGVSACFLPCSNGQTRVLVLTGGNLQGSNWSWPFLLTVKDGAWIEVPLTEENVLDDGSPYFYQITEHMNENPLLLVLENTEGDRAVLWEEYPKMFSNVAAALVWEPDAAMFLPLTEENPD